MERYFVVVSARTKNDMRALGKYGYDLFPNTAKDTRDGSDFPLRIDGLLTTAETEVLVKDGYRVAVEKPVEGLSAAVRERRTLEFEDWLQLMQPLIEEDRKVTE